MLVINFIQYRSRKVLFLNLKTHAFIHIYLILKILFISNLFKIFIIRVYLY